MPSKAVVHAISISDGTELVAQLRNQLAAILREQADDEPPAVAQRLREIASAFESDAGPGVVLDVHQQHDGSYAKHAPMVKR